MLYSRRIRRATKDAVSARGVEELQEVDHVDVDQLYDFSQGHVVNQMQGRAYTGSKAVDVPPPIPYEGADDLPIGRIDDPIEVYYPTTRPGVGPDDLEPMIPEGELGF